MLFDIVSVNPERTGHGGEGYYFAENGHSSWYDIAHAIGKALVELKVVDEAEPTLFTPDELVKYWGSAVRSYLSLPLKCRHSVLKEGLNRFWATIGEQPASAVQTAGAHWDGCRSTPRRTC